VTIDATPDVLSAEWGSEPVVAPVSAREPRLDASSVAALTALHARHYVPLVRLARTFVDTEASAEEIVQEAFERVLRKWSGLRDVAAAEAYLRRSVVNGCRDRLRRRAVRRAFRPTGSAVVLSAEDTAVLNEQQQRVLLAVRRLPLRQREVLLLRYFAEWSEADIATALGISKGTVKSSAHKGLAALRGVLSKENEL
jgi:RNA polymerase sigma-70 factor (sigma-E family)